MNFETAKAVINCKIFSAVRKQSVVDVSRLVRGISLYESLESPHVTCNLTLLDGNSVRSTLPIVGGEAVRVEIYEEGQEDESVECDFRVSRIGARNAFSMDSEQYTLYLYTPQEFRERTKSVAKPYAEKYSEIVKKVVSEYLEPKKLFDCEETAGLVNIVPTGIGPTSFLMKCVHESESEQNPSSYFFFFETFSQGYTFGSLDWLFSRRESHKFVYDLSVTQSMRSTKTRNNIFELTTIKNPEVTRPGQFNQQTLSFDPLSKSFRNVISQNPSPDIVDPEVLEVLSAPTSSKFMITNGHRFDVEYISSKIPNAARRRQNFAGLEDITKGLYSNMRVRVVIPGNTNVHAGQTINLVVPNQTETVEDRPQNERFTSGKYLVAALSHNVETNGDFYTVMECIRPKYEEKVAR